jgi:hypothetical protein
VEQQNIEALTDANRKTCLQENTKETKYKFMPQHLNARKKHNTKIDKFIYLRMKAINQNHIHKQIKSTLRRVLGAGIA